MTNNNKPLLSTPQLIAHLKSKGITFNYISEIEAVDFLENHNYFFKLYSYRKNYQKILAGKNAGKYIGLDFAYLKELSILDYHLRILILHMSLNLEHALKVMLIKDIEDNPAEDGYQIVEDWNTENLTHGQPSKITRIESRIRSGYCQDIIRKFHGKPYPIWAICEIISFGELCKLVKVYKSKYPGRLLFNIDLLFHVRDIRNAAAHNNCLINDFTPGRYSFNLSAQGTVLTREIAKISSISKNARTKKLSNKVIYDIVSLFCLYPQIVKSPVICKKTRNALLDLFLVRAKRHQDYFSSNATITTTYSFFLNTIKYFFP